MRRGHLQGLSAPRDSQLGKKNLRQEFTVLKPLCESKKSDEVRHEVVGNNAAKGDEMGRSAKDQIFAGVVARQEFGLLVQHVAHDLRRPESLAASRAHEYLWDDIFGEFFHIVKVPESVSFHPRPSQHVLKLREQQSS